MTDDRWPDKPAPAPSADDATITVAQAAEMLGWHPFKVFYHLELGRVPGARKRGGIWAIDRERLRAAIDSGELG